MIGDPSMKSQERNLLDEQTLAHNVACIKKQLSRFLDFDSDAPNKAELVNNYDWMKDYTFIDFTRRRRDDTISIDRAGETMCALPAPDSPNPEEHMITHQNAAQFEQFLNKMTPRYRELIQLRFFREFSYKEIADKLQLPIGTVKTQIHRAREQLCRYITEHNDDQP